VTSAGHRKVDRLTSRPGPKLTETPLWPDNPTAEDLLGFADIAEPVLEAIAREKLNPVTMGVFGDWGSGKTTVLEILQERLAGKDEVIVVYTRPWGYDPSLDPRATLIGEVLTAVQTRVDAEKGGLGQLADRFSALRKRIQWSKAIAVAGQTAMTFSIPSADKIVDIFSGDDPLADPTLQGFHEEFDSLMGELEGVKRVVVLVDDLDRCLPTSVVQTLEAIKLFLSVQKMAFVIAADQRLVELAIAERYGAAQQATRMAREYLEKIIQIPVSVPALGHGDTEAYLALMLIERHFEDAGETRRKIVEHTEERRRRAEPRVLQDLPNDLLPGGAKPDADLASMLAPVLYARLGGNPRRLKRFLNAFWVRQGIAARRGVTLEATVLAKLMVLEQLEPDAFGRLLEWVGQGTLGESLGQLEGGESSKDAHSGLKWWAEMSPRIAHVDLRPYLRLAASLRSQTGPRSELRADLRELLDSLHGGTTSSRTEAGKRLGQLPTEDRMLMARETLDLMRVEPGAQSQLSEPLTELARDPGLTDVLVTGLRRLSPQSLDSGVIIAVGGAGAPYDAFQPVLREWLESGQLDEVQENAAREVLDEEG